MQTKHQQYWTSLNPAAKEKRLAQMREYREKQYIAECEAAGREYIPREIRLANRKHNYPKALSAHVLR